MQSKKTVRQSVEAILRDYPETRNCDKTLILRYWEMVDEIRMDSMIEFRNGFISTSTMPESITRARRLIQEEGFYLPTKDYVLVRRSKREQAMKKEIIGNRQVI